MKNSLAKFCAIFLCGLLCFSAPAAASELEMDLQPDGLYLNNTNVAVLQKIFSDYKYDDFVRKDKKLPPIFMKTLPSDFDKIKSQDERNRLFIMIMAPLTLKTNEEIIFERNVLRKIKEDFDAGKDLTDEQKSTLEKLIKKYDVFTRMKGRDYYNIILHDLMLKVDVIAPSLLIAAAAAESNWGTAIEVKQGNALYKMKNWYTDEGIKPEGEDDDSYRIKTYPDLLSATRDYALKINSDINFHQLRVARRQIMNRNKNMRGRTTVYNMVVGSPLENYAGLLNYILTFYDLIYVDESSLGSIDEMENK